MEILQLRYFFESAENESFAKTAEKYRVPATSVSASVKRLEKELGCELFTRTSNRIILNDNGKSFRQSMRVIFDELDRAVDSLTSASTDSREIKILVCAMRSTITDLIIEYKTRHPHINFKTVFDFNETDFKKYDIIIDEHCNKYPEHNKIDLYTTKIRLIAASENPLCRKKLTLSQLENQPFISIGENNGLHRILINACNNAGFMPNIVVQSNDLMSIRKYVDANVGIGLAREYSHSGLRPGIEYLNITDFNEKQTICIYFRQQSAYGNVEHFLKFLKSKTI